MLNANSRTQIDRTRIAIELDGSRSTNVARAQADSKQQRQAQALHRARSREEMLSATPLSLAMQSPGFNMNGNANTNVVSRNIREAALVMQNGYRQTNGNKDFVPAGPPQKSLPVANGYRHVNAPPQRPLGVSAPNGYIVPPPSVPAPVPRPGNVATASTASLAPAHQVGPAHTAGFSMQPQPQMQPNLGPNMRHMNGHVPVPPVQPQPGSIARLPGTVGGPLQRGTQSQSALQKSLQQQVERFIQQQAAQHNGRAAEAPVQSHSSAMSYALPSSNSASSISQFASSVNSHGHALSTQSQVGSFRPAMINGLSNSAVMRGPNPSSNGGQVVGFGGVSSSQPPHLAAAPQTQTPITQLQPQPSSAVDSVLQHLHAAAVRTNQQLSPTAQFTAEPFYSVNSAGNAQTPTPAPTSGKSSQVQQVTARPNSTAANGTFAVSVVSSRGVRPVITAPANSTAVAATNTSQPNNLAGGERTRPLIYAPRSVIADTYLKQERRIDSTVQTQRFLDMLNYIRKQQAHQAGVHAALSSLIEEPHQATSELDQLTVSGALAQSVALSAAAMQPDYNYVVDHVDKVHIRINTPRSVHRRASITDSAEDLRRITEALVINNSQYLPASSAELSGAAGDTANPAANSPGLPVSITTPSFALSLSALAATNMNGSDTEEGASNSSKSDSITQPAATTAVPANVIRIQVEEPAKPRSILRVTSAGDKADSQTRHGRKVCIAPLALLLDSSLEGELEKVREMCNLTDPSTPNDEGITALHNAVCAGHIEVCRYLVEAGANVNAADADGWTPLHCAASCNNFGIVRLLVENGACLSSTTADESETPVDKCEADTHLDELELTIQDEDGGADVQASNGTEPNSETDRDLANEIDVVRLTGNAATGNNDTSKRPMRHANRVSGGRRNESCRDYLQSVFEKIGVANGGRVYALFDHEASSSEELSLAINEELFVVQRPNEEDWWLVRNRDNRTGYVPRAYLGLYPRKLK